MHSASTYRHLPCGTIPRTFLLYPPLPTDLHHSLEMLMVPGMIQFAWMDLSWSGCISVSVGWKSNGDGMNVSVCMGKRFVYVWVNLFDSCLCTSFNQHLWYRFRWFFSSFFSESMTNWTEFCSHHTHHHFQSIPCHTLATVITFRLRHLYVVSHV